MQRETTNNLWIKYSVTSVIGLLVTLGFCWFRGLFRETDSQEILRILCDGFLLTGVLMLGIGLLSLLKKEGTYDGLFYSFRAMRETWLKRHNNEPSSETYYDYKQKASKKRKVAWHLIIVGGALLLISIALLIVYSVNG